MRLCAKGTMGPRVECFCQSDCLNNYKKLWTFHLKACNDGLQSFPKQWKFSFPFVAKLSAIADASQYSCDNHKSSRHLHQPGQISQVEYQKAKWVGKSVNKTTRCLDLSQIGRRNLIAWNSLTKKDHIYHVSYIYETLIDKQFGDKTLIPEFWNGE